MNEPRLCLRATLGLARFSVFWSHTVHSIVKEQAMQRQNTVPCERVAAHEHMHACMTERYCIGYLFQCHLPQSVDTSFRGSVNTHARRASGLLASFLLNAQRMHSTEHEQHTLSEALSTPLFLCRFLFSSSTWRQGRRHEAGKREAASARTCSSDPGTRTRQTCTWTVGAQS